MKGKKRIISIIVTVAMICAQTANVMKVYAEDIPLSDAVDLGNDYVDKITSETATTTVTESEAYDQAVTTVSEIEEYIPIMTTTRVL